MCVWRTASRAISAIDHASLGRRQDRPSPDKRNCRHSPEKHFQFLAVDQSERELLSPSLPPVNCRVWPILRPRCVVSARSLNDVSDPPEAARAYSCAFTCLVVDKMTPKSLLVVTTSLLLGMCFLVIDGDIASRRRLYERRRERAQRCRNRQGFFADADEPSKFYRCVRYGPGHFQAFDFRCGEGTVFSERHSVCVRPSRLRGSSNRDRSGRLLTPTGGERYFLLTTKIEILFADSE